ncbi:MULTISPECIES: MarR family winged helix-turn-helix transcriptional regulator [Paenibacillus]|uniref:MarR family transcriptional regulator n=1 Tax=Paenibacillus baimaensis TaxID=2982185 RepID=A0ABT2UE92_9BACL|nr:MULTISPECIES: MarR family transcriptional regulator [unclassified Paenibacillus]MCU6792922.1 MarR family transcriptional regulator [Paenibacillus sp. WQ 127069]OMF13073.1 MarR family transcriptional regulator [Paenibacillus sp. FSL H7-0331]
MFQEDEQSQLDLRLIRVWGKASRTVFENVKKDIVSHGLDPVNFMILELLYSKGPHPVQKISETFSIPSGSITYVVDKLETKALVKREASPTDRRTSNVVLTEKGKLFFDEIFPKHVETISHNLSFISNEEKEQLIHLMKKIGLGAKELG